MAAPQDLSSAQMAFQVAGSDPGRYLVTRYKGTEGLCQLYRFEIELVSSESGVDFEDFVGKAATLTINTDHGERRFHGIISQFEVTGETVDQTYFRADLVPSVWLLTNQYRSRILQNITVPQIIGHVLFLAGIPADGVRFDLKRTYTPREYCVQYRETDYNFICRLMEEEGIWWYFEQPSDAPTADQPTAAGEVLVCADSPGHYAPIDGDASLEYRPPSGMVVNAEHVFRFRLGRSVRPNAVMLREFNFQKPRLDLQSSHNGGNRDREISDYPGEYDNQARGTELAQIRHEEFQAARTLGFGQSNCRRMMPARTFGIAGHPQQGLNGNYLLTSVTHQGKQATPRSTAGTNGRLHVFDARVHQSLVAARQSESGATRELAEGILQIASSLKGGDPTAHRMLTSWLYHAGQVSRDPAAAAIASGGSPLEALAIPNLIQDIANSPLADAEAPTYECRFECIPADVTYRPPRVTPWPTMRGTQTARIVGPKNEEIYTDEYGRVKVQFHWDRDGRFDENASCWIRVSQGMAGGQYGMMFLPRVGQEVVVDFLEGDPDQPIITGRVYNGDHMPPYKLPDEKTKSCIKTHSSHGGGGTNEILFEDRKGAELIRVFAQGNLHTSVNCDHVETIGNDRHLRVGRNQTEHVKENKSCQVELDSAERINGKRSVYVGADNAEQIWGNSSHIVVGNVTIGGQTVLIEAMDALSLKVGGNFITLDAKGIAILGTMVNINNGGTAPPLMGPEPSYPAEPLWASRSTPGHDTRYDGGEAPTKAEPDDTKKKASWIEIELVDERGRPVPNEAYEIVAPDGKTIRRGNLDEKGQARESVPESGKCEIYFPNLDAEAWDRG